MELNWLPDHEAVERLVGPVGPLLTGDQIEKALRERPGLVPAAIDPASQTVIWADVGQHDLHEWQFIFSVQALAETHGRLATVQTELEAMPALEPYLGDIVPPRGFIFHMSRCGSTLLGNVLSGSPRHLSVNQPGPLQDGFWTVLTKDWSALPVRSNSQAYVPVFRHLVQAILRRRSPHHIRGFVKFRSWNVLFLSFIRQAFPNVPFLFLYRDPVEVIASTIQKKNVAQFANLLQQSFLSKTDETELQSLSDSDFMTRCYDNYFTSVLGIGENNIKLLNYKNVECENLKHILKNAFSINANDEEIKLMNKKFSFYSKGRRNKSTLFNKKKDVAAKEKILKPSIVASVQNQLHQHFMQLERAPNNLYPDRED